MVKRWSQFLSLYLQAWCLGLGSVNSRFHMFWLLFFFLQFVHCFACGHWIFPVYKPKKIFWVYWTLLVMFSFFYRNWQAQYWLPQVYCWYNYILNLSERLHRPHNPGSCLWNTFNSFSCLSFSQRERDRIKSWAFKVESNGLYGFGQYPHEDNQGPLVCLRQKQVDHVDLICVVEKFDFIVFSTDSINNHRCAS